MVLRDVTWADYQRILELRGEHSAPRLHYADGVLEIMSPSRDHGAIKSRIGQLVEVYCLEAGIDFDTLGSWTLEDKLARRGLEPDECYVFGPSQQATRPDLAIEVIWTSGSLAKLDTYRALGVREVWVWQRGVITSFVLGADGYVEQAGSAVLPGLQFAQLASFLDQPSAAAAMRAYRDALRG